MSSTLRRLRTPEERVGMLPNACLPPPDARGTSHEDRLLLRALRDRDESTFADAMDAHYSPMLRVALSHVRDREAAEEVVQDTWLAAIEGIARFEGRSSISTWLYQILRNIARRRGRRDDRFRPLSALQSPDAGASGFDPLDRVVDGRTAVSGHTHAAAWAGSQPDAGEQVLSVELARHVDAALDLLPPRQREVITLRDVEGWSAEDVCNVLGISGTNQRVLLHRARERVRNALRYYLASNDELHCDECDDDMP